MQKTDMVLWKFIKTNCLTQHNSMVQETQWIRILNELRHIVNRITSKVKVLSNFRYGGNNYGKVVLVSTIFTLSLKLHRKNQ